MTERLWEVPSLFARFRVDLLGEQPERTRVLYDAFKQRARCLDLPRTDQRVDEPERTEHEWWYPLNGLINFVFPVCARRESSSDSLSPVIH